MKYLKKSAEVLVGNAGGQNEDNLGGNNLADYTAMLTMITYGCDGAGEAFLGICATPEHLEQIRNAIDNYLFRTDGNALTSERVGFVNNLNIKSETSEEEIVRVFATVSQQVTERLQNRNQQKQTELVIDPRLVIVNQFGPSENQNSWSAKLRLLSGLKDFSTDGRIELSVLGSSEKEVREKLNTGFYHLIMACINPDLSESRIPDIVHENQRPVNSAQDTKIKPIRFDLSKVTSRKINEKEWIATIKSCEGYEIAVVSGLGDTETEAKTQLYQKLIFLSADCFCYANEPENNKQINETGNKDATQFKLNSSRVMSMKIGVDKWEARTRLFNGIGDRLVDLVATADSEESARKELDKKFSDFAGPMTNFIKFMSQVS